ncbi:putative quinol monooxygenase [Noviherbaspirillum sp. CPCC 100848]|jgi:quinol monooxygenase YgiN|uniref:Quinol monooxygenase n=1 Tax=Noviherbaspirillum album TaxID=3080276 RepID=A0ABU6J496_9BURK|nr:putative quinol monooxygenase [Noviherbaspirillum sp. CPCC 100848]MEC4718348.1 putative quinol monooxygenase [Noviherbaspirillum sp. CPCC 100848]
MNDFFNLVALRARPGREEELRAQLIALVAPSRRDEGSIQYEMLSQPDDPTRFFFIEHWSSSELQHKHHTATDHILNFEKNYKDELVEAVEFYYRLNRVV